MKEHYVQMSWGLMRVEEAAFKQIRQKYALKVKRLGDKFFIKMPKPVKRKVPKRRKKKAA